MPILVTHKDEVKISAHDKSTLRNLEIDAINGLQEDGSSTRRVIWNLQEAFRLGFTARGRGEAEGQDHPPLPASMTEEAIRNEDRYFLPVGTVVEWVSQSRGSYLKKRGTIVDVLAPGAAPDELRWGGLYRNGKLLHSCRSKISYVVSVAPRMVSTAATKLYWPRTGALTVVPPTTEAPAA